MNFTAYLKDRPFAFIIRLAALFTILVFLIAFRTPVPAIITVIVILSASCVLSDAIDYARRKRFYDLLNTSLTNLDQKYLLPEMLPNADFLEGRLIKDVLGDCSRSMTEQVAFYRRQSKEFREYIEMWVHEAKLPIAALELICRNNPEIKSKMNGQLLRLDDYVENVLYYARSENAEKDYVIKPVSLQKAFGNTAVRNREVLQLANAEIEASDLNIQVMTDGKWLEFMIGQFMANSLKYMSPSRPLKIRAYAQDLENKTIFHFRDNGIGIGEDDLPRVFEKTFTGSNGRLKPGSTGMGLYIVKSLCNRLGHSVTITSEKDVYTEITLTFAKNDHLKPGD